MFDNQIQRVKDNILPFVFIGLIIGIVIGKASWFRSIGWINSYLKYSGINTYYPDSGQILFLNHFGPETLTFLLVAMFAFAGIYRIALGSREEGPRSSSGMVQSFENFGSLLAIAWLGLILGIAVPTLIFQGFSSFIAFFVSVFYPLVFLTEVNFCTSFLSGDTLRKVHDSIERYGRGNLGIRAEGICLLALSILMLTYVDKHTDVINSFTHFIRSIL
jgi:hypothetical protein